MQGGGSVQECTVAAGEQVGGGSGTVEWRGGFRQETDESSTHGSTPLRRAASTPLPPTLINLLIRPQPARHSQNSPPLTGQLELPPRPTVFPARPRHSHGSLNLAAVMSFCSCARPLARKGGMPLSISYRRMPTLHQSTALPCPRPVITSGACQGTDGAKSACLGKGQGSAHEHVREQACKLSEGAAVGPCKARMQGSGRKCHHREQPLRTFPSWDPCQAPQQC